MILYIFLKKNINEKPLSTPNYLTLTKNMGKGIHVIIPLSKERETERQLQDNYRLG